VVTLVERTSRLVILLAVGFNRGTIHISELIVAMLKGLPASMKRSLTWDQGSEMAHWRKIQDQTGVPIYLCNPASPWQRGTNENTNRLIRFWLPKGTNLNTHTQNDLNKIAELINTHPRRIHDWQTANQVYNQLVHWPLELAGGMTKSEGLRDFRKISRKISGLFGTIHSRMLAWQPDVLDSARTLDG
jgi:transposase, IS30 family